MNMRSRTTAKCTQSGILTSLSASAKKCVDSSLMRFGIPGNNIRGGRVARRRSVAAVVGSLLLSACGTNVSTGPSGNARVDSGPSSQGGGFAMSDAGSNQAGALPSLLVPDASASGSSSVDAGSCTPNMTGRLRDFVNQSGFMPTSALDNDFENETGDDRGLVETDLGADLKPVYAHGPNSTATTHGQAQFDMWYRDTSGTNIPYDYSLPLVNNGGVQTFDDQEFFPLDGRGWNDEYTADDGNLHNFSFTFELHTTFSYAGGETFTFTGDDDVFVFINKKLVVDLGGVHSTETKSISLDSLVTDDSSQTQVPLTRGTTYGFDIFYNERHTTASHFRMDTSIGFNNCAAIIAPK
jgi:fibro-slime domain-containing protein